MQMQTRMSPRTSLDPLSSRCLLAAMLSKRASISIRESLDSSFATTEEISHNNERYLFCSCSIASFHSLGFHTMLVTHPLSIFAGLYQSYGNILASDLRVFGRTKEAINSSQGFGGLCGRDAFRPSLIFGIVKPIHGMAFLFQAVTLFVLHFWMAIIQMSETPDWGISAAVSLPSKDGC